MNSNTEQKSGMAVQQGMSSYTHKCYVCTVSFAAGAHETLKKEDISQICPNLALLYGSDIFFLIVFLSLCT
jgi:hypothetical protein